MTDEPIQPEDAESEDEESSPPTYPEPDFSMCGIPLIELMGGDRLDEHVEAAAKVALDNPTVQITVGTWPGETLKSGWDGWMRRQRPYLQAWRSQYPLHAPGTLKLRSRTIVRPGMNIVTAAFVVFTPAKPKKAGA